MGEILFKVLGFPIFYWIGFAIVKGLSLGRAKILPFSDFGKDGELVCSELRVYRQGSMFWSPESMVLIAGSAVLLAMGCYSAYAIYTH